MNGATAMVLSYGPAREHRRQVQQMADDKHASDAARAVRPVHHSTCLCMSHSVTCQHLVVCALVHLGNGLSPQNLKLAGLPVLLDTLNLHLTPH